MTTLTRYSLRRRDSGEVIAERDSSTFKAFVQSLARERANLTWANLTWANLTRANLTDIRADVYQILDTVPNEVPGLRAAFAAGRVDGTVYSGECACLIGTVANLRGCAYNAIPGVVANASRPAERFVMGVAKGATPDTNPISRIMVEWIDEWLSKRQEVPT